MLIRSFAFVFLLLFLLVSMSSCFTFRKSNDSTLKKAKKFGVKLAVKNFHFKENLYRYFRFDNINDSMPLLILIHGAPGSSADFIDFLKNPLITGHYSVIIIDRPGYGFSNFGYYATFQEQSDIIIALIYSIVKKDQGVFIAGHSYGGTITATIASLRPNFLTASALMAPALDPKNEKYFWFSKLGKWKASRWMASGALKVATDEKYNHANQLESWSNRWKDINSPLIHIHGTKDNVVPFINLSYSKFVFPNKLLEACEWEGINHFFPFSHTDKTISILHKYFSKHKTKHQ